jgi:hypothetical protein
LRLSERDGLTLFRLAIPEMYWFVRRDEIARWDALERRLGAA